jgi:hypothetical protein
VRMFLHGQDSTGLHGWRGIGCHTSVCESSRDFQGCTGSHMSPQATGRTVFNVPPAWPSPRRHSREVPVAGSLSVSSSPTVRFEAGNNSKGC